MKSATIRWIIVGATLSIIGIVSTQIYWVRKAFVLEEQQFEQSAKTALFSVVKHLTEYNETVMPLENPVRQISGNYYIVNVNDVIDANVLEHFLISEFNRRNLDTDFEYGIYDCTNDEMVYGNYVSSNNEEAVPENQNLPKYDNYEYYFGVRFPTRNVYIASRMGIWVFSTFILLVVIIFFASTIFVILRQKRLSEVQKDFINNMTHEFKTPLSTIGISTDVLLRQNAIEDSDRLRKYASIIRSETDRLNNQVMRVLQMARIDKDEQRLKLKKVQLEKVVEEAVNGQSEKAEARGGKIETDIECSAEIVADEVHLENIIHNLLENAINYCKGVPKIKVSIKETAKHYLLEVADNGIGIEKEHQKKIFDKFYRVPKGNVHDVKGFGIGLNYVASTVKAHKWKISLTSEFGKGSIFSIRIPKK